VDHIQDIIFAGVFLVSCISLGISGIIITRNKTNLTPIARRRIKEYEDDNKNLLTEIRRLKGVVSRQKQGPTIHESDIKAGEGGTILDTIIDGLPQNYKKIARKYKHMIEPVVLNEDGSLKPEVVEKIKSITTAGPKQELDPITDRSL
jgi:hypothetical protein